MLKEYAGSVRYFSMILDILIVSVSFCIAYLLRKYFHYYDFFAFSPHEMMIREINYSAEQILWIIIYSCLSFSVSLRYLNTYSSQRTSTLPSLFTQYLKGTVLSIGIILITLFMLHINLSRFLLLFFFIVTYALFCAKEIATYFFLRNIRRKGFNFRNLLIVGTGANAKKYLKKVKDNKQWGFKVHGFIDDLPDKVGSYVMGHKIVGTLKDLPGILENEVIDEVVFAVPASWIRKIAPLMEVCETYGVKTRLMASFFDTSIAKPILFDLDGIPVITFEMIKISAFNAFLKHVIDIVGAVVTLVLSLPLMIAISIAIKLEDGGPVFFMQIRSGCNGRPFGLLKFRSMVVNAEEKRAEMEHLNEQSGPVFKVANDPRVTRVGKFLRKTSMDELPQFFNVLKNEMSLVGPRPPLPSEVKEYKPSQYRKLSMKPGITCIWQTSGRNKINFEDWMLLDLKYIDNWSLWLDIKLLLKTIPALLFTSRGV